MAQFVLPRRGVFVLQRRGEAVAVDTSTAIVLAAGEEYRVSHPGTDGDDCTVVVLPDEGADEVIAGDGGRTARLGPRENLAVHLLTRALQGGGADRLEAEEVTLLMLARLRRAFSRTADRPSFDARARVEEVRSLLAGSPELRWDLRTLADAVHCSPFHLCRQFRATTGQTMSRYLLGLRLSAALDRLAAGERDLATLALETGFAHHSHFTSRFRRAFGVTPARARHALTTAPLDHLRVTLEDVAAS